MLKPPVFEIVESTIRMTVWLALFWMPMSPRALMSAPGGRMRERDHRRLDHARFRRQHLPVLGAAELLRPFAGSAQMPTASSRGRSPPSVSFRRAVQVEVVTVAEIAVARADVADHVGDLVQGIVVHPASMGGA
jgi:hypothetical protein